MREEALFELLEGRRSYRRFDESKKIEDNIVKDIAKSLNFYSSAANLQPLRFKFVTDENKVNDIFEVTNWAGRLPKEVGRPKKGERPTMFVVVYYDEKDKNKWIDIDAGLAISNLTITAWNYGVGSCIIASFDEETTKEILDMKNQYKIPCVIGFGYPTHKSFVEQMDGEEVAYYLDENKDYHVPKRKQEDIVEFI